MPVTAVVMWVGAAVAVLGFTLTWTYLWQGRWFFWEEGFETAGRWLMRAGSGAAVLGAATTLLTGGW